MTNERSFHDRFRAIPRGAENKPTQHARRAASETVELGGELDHLPDSDLHNASVATPVLIEPSGRVA